MPNLIRIALANCSDADFSLCNDKFNARIRRRSGNVWRGSHFRDECNNIKLFNPDGCKNLPYG